MNNSSLTVGTLTAIGGSEWQAGDKHRVYFNDLLELADGIEVSFYKSGSINSVRVDGGKLSNNKGRALIGLLPVAKFWYDLQAGEFASQDISSDMHDRIVRGIAERAEAA